MPLPFATEASHGLVSFSQSLYRLKDRVDIHTSFHLLSGHCLYPSDHTQANTPFLISSVTFGMSMKVVIAHPIP